jgi:hypothetical protein
MHMTLGLSIASKTGGGELDFEDSLSIGWVGSLTHLSSNPSASRLTGAKSKKKKKARAFSDT